MSCSTVKDAIRILKRVRQSGYRDVSIEDLDGNMVDVSEFEEPRAKAA